MATLNIASLPKHFDEISLMLHDKKIDILALNETHLDPSTSDELVSVDGYPLIRADRNRNGGGVCMYARCNMNYQNRMNKIDVCITSTPEKIISSGVIHLGISDHSLIYAIRKLNCIPKTRTQTSVEYRNFKNFNAESFLSDLYILPWTEIDNKENVDAMWECWKSLFVQVLDKHAPFKTRRVRKRGSVPWINKDVRKKLFERDFLKRKAIKMNYESDWNKYKSSRNSANIALRQAKREYYITKFQNPKTNPRHAWQNILGRNNNTNTIHEIKHSGKTVGSNEELKEIFNEYFTNI